MRKRRARENGNRYQHTFCSVVQRTCGVYKDSPTTRRRKKPGYAELLAHPNATEAFLERFLLDTGITVDFQLDQPVWVEAGRRFARYANHRRGSGFGEPKRLLADFLIGSHALLQADQLMSLDPTPYKQYFPDLRLV